MIEIPIHPIHPHNVAVGHDPENPELWWIDLWSGQGMHRVAMTRKQLENLGREIEQRLKAQNGASAPE